MIADLHCHTNFSDNNLTLFQVIRLAKERGVTHLAITDHDTTAGLRIAMDLGVELGVEIIPGIEISAYDYEMNRRAHILGYYVRPEDTAIRTLCAPVIARRHAASRLMVETLAAHGYAISWDQVVSYAGTTGVFKQHIMHALKNAGYCDGIFGELYHILFSRGGKGKEPGIAFVPIVYVDAMDAIRAIRDAGGVAVLAHPGQFNNYDAIPRLVKAGLEGIEARHPCHDTEAKELACRLAREFNLIITGGSDFHGLYADYPDALGIINAGIESVCRLRERALRAHPGTQPFSEVPPDNPKNRCRLRY